MGLDRQADSFLPFCERHGLIPNPDPLIDRGLSAFHGKHRRKGALGAFIRAAQSGQVPAGSVLVVDDLSRFSREPSSRSEQLLHQLWDEGLALGIVSEDKVVDRQTYDKDLSVQVMLMTLRKLHNEESATKSRLIADVWERRRLAAAQGQKYPAARPFWCDWDKASNDFKLNDQAIIPPLMVQLSIEGKGMTQIAAYVNALGFRNSSGKPFTYSWVRRILADRRLLGEQCWKGDEKPLQGYFPSVVKRESWEACWAAIKSRDDRKGKVGRGQHIHNLFQGMTRCPCGSPLTYMPTRGRGGIRNYAYLRCTGKSNGTCTGPKGNWRYDEEALLRAYMDVRWATFFDRPGSTRQCQKIEAKLLGLEGVHAREQQQVANAELQMQEAVTSKKFDEDLLKMIGKAAKKAKASASSTQEKIAALQEELRALLAQPDGAERQQQIKKRTKAFMDGQRGDPVERRNFNNWLLTLGVEVTITDPKIGRMEWGATDAVVYRLRDGTVVSDESLGDMAVLGFSEADREVRLEEIKAEKRMAAKVGWPRRQAKPVALSVEMLQGKVVKDAAQVSSPTSSP